MNCFDIIVFDCNILTRVYVICSFVNAIHFALFSFIYNPMFLEAFKIYRAFFAFLKVLHDRTMQSVYAGACDNQLKIVPLVSSSVTRITFSRDVLNRSNASALPCLAPTVFSNQLAEISFCILTLHTTFEHTIEVIGICS